MDGKLCTRMIRLLTHTLLRNAQLARSVRTLSLTNDDCRSDDERDCHHEGDQIFDAAPFVPALRDYCHTTKNQLAWEEDLKSRVEDDPWLALLLPRLPNLEILHFCFFDEIPHLTSLLKNSLIWAKILDTPTTLLPNLKEVSLKWLFPELPMVDLLPFFRLPSLQRFIGVQLRLCRPDEYTYPEKSEQSAIPVLDDDAIGFSTVTSLHFHKSASSNGFRRMIAACAKLEEFICVHYDYGESEPLKPALIRSHLYRHKETLQVLAMVYYDEIQRVFDNYEAVGSLADFIALKRVYLRAPNMFPDDDDDTPASRGSARRSLVHQLPSSIEVLGFTNIEDVDWDMFYEELREVVSVAHTRFPRLNRLMLEDHELPADKQAKDEFGAFCRKQGIELSWMGPLLIARSLMD